MTATNRDLNSARAPISLDRQSSAGSAARKAIAATLSAGAALGMAADSSAAVVLSPLTGDIAIDPWGNVLSDPPTGRLSFNVDGVDDTDVSFSYAAPNTFNMGAIDIQIDLNPYAKAFAFGEFIPNVVGPGSSALLALANNLDVLMGTGDGNFVDLAEPQFAGFYFTDASTARHAAWAKLNVEFGPYTDAFNVTHPNAAILRILGFGYETDADTGIIAGVPEPAAASLALLAAGAVGVGASPAQ